MSTRSTSNELVSSFSNPKRVVRNRQRNRGDLSLLLDFEDINMNPNNQGPPPNNQGPPPIGPIPPPIPQNYSPPGHNLENPAPDLRTMEELCQPTMNGRGRPIAPINIQATDFGLKNHMIQHVQNSCQFHGLPSDDANKHLDKFLTITQSMKQNRVTDDALRLCLFPYSLTHHATAWFDRLLKNYIHTFKEMISKFLSKYFPPSMITKIRNDISNFRQLPDESLFEAWERYKLLIDRCLNHNMLPVTQIDTFYNRLTLRHRDTINVAAGANEMTKIEKAFNERPQGALHSNTIPNPREDVKAITTQSGMTLAGPSVPPPNPSSSKEVEQDSETTMDQIPERNPHQPHIPYPSRLNKEKLQDKSDSQIHKFLQMFKKLHFNISSAEALAQMPNELEECMALADLGARINLMPLSVWKMLMLPELVPTCMTLELANWSVAYPNGIAEDVFVQVGKFTFPADFVVVDYDVDPRVPLILGRPFLRMTRALVDVHREELTLRVGDEK
ncbi:reverse transcriptase domain-containing protein [Tanacetum coccineum]